VPLLSRLVAFVLTFTTLYAQAPYKEKPPLTVCEVIAKRSVYNGQIVAVPGRVGGGGHGIWLDSPDCEYKLVTRGVEWPNVIFLTTPSNKSPDVADHANFDTDWSTIDKSQEAVKRAGFNINTDRIIATYVGLFVTYLDLEKRVNPGILGALRLGFGPVGLGAPAQLLIKIVKDTVVVHGQPPR
jgi:hypothetical protein